MNTLVTGASGFLGRFLCQALQQGGHKVTALLEEPCEGPWDKAVLAKLPASLDSAPFENIEVVFHLAGKAHALAETRQDAQDYERINTQGTRAVLKACKQTRVRRLVLYSSVKAMSEPGELCADERFACEPETPYGQSKLKAERLLLDGGFVPEPVVLRLSMVYGLSAKGNLPRMIHAIRRRRFPPPPEFGNRRSMVHHEDVVQAALLAATRPEAVGQTYIVTDGQAYSTRQIYELICSALHRPPPRWHAPQKALRGLALAGDLIGRARGRRFFFDSDALAKLAGSAHYSSAKIVKELGFQPKWTLPAALPAIIEYLSRA